MSNMTEKNRQDLIKRAYEVQKHAYAPYSKFPVGSSVMTTSGRIYVGCNVENASYGLTLCAECIAIGSMIAAGDCEIQAICCVNSKGEIIMPCGRCRQIIYEHSPNPDESIVLRPEGHITVREILPYAFDLEYA